ncbi:hypothetical protein FPV67DRAFT_1508794 [Lyophyllum atratum]|nr:hypothetical protein FPV67DRAFT_1508794 [Lyophyllum atratum]
MADVPKPDSRNHRSPTTAKSPCKYLYSTRFLDPRSIFQHLPPSITDVSDEFSTNRRHYYSTSATGSQILERIEDAVGQVVFCRCCIPKIPKLVTHSSPPYHQRSRTIGRTVATLPSQSSMLLGAMNNDEEDGAGHSEFVSPEIHVRAEYLSSGDDFEPFDVIGRTEDPFDIDGIDLFTLPPFRPPDGSSTSYQDKQRFIENSLDVMAARIHELAESIKAKHIVFDANVSSPRAAHVSCDFSRDNPYVDDPGIWKTTLPQ